MLNEQHHVVHSPLAGIGIGLMSQFVLDYMHLACLGVVKRLIWLWMKGPLINNCRLASSTLKRMSDSLVSLKCYMPREFNGKCKPLCEVERWKATEYRNWASCTNISCFFSEHFLFFM